LEVAQRVWQRSLELAGTGGHLHLSDQALALARAAGHDPDTMAHALGLGRSQARHPSNDEATRRGVWLLERAITYLGVRAVPDEIARTGSRRAATPRARVSLSVVREGEHRRPDNDRPKLPAPAESQPWLPAGSWPPEPLRPPDPVPPPEPLPPPEPVPPLEPLPPPEPDPRSEAMRPRILGSGGTPVSPRRLPGH
jgi:hypothetical protein